MQIECHIPLDEIERVRELRRQLRVEKHAGFPDITITAQQAINLGQPGLPDENVEVCKDAAIGGAEKALSEIRAFEQNEFQVRSREHLRQVSQFVDQGFLHYPLPAADRFDLTYRIFRERRAKRAVEHRQD